MGEAGGWELRFGRESGQPACGKFGD